MAIHDVRAFGAVGDGMADDTDAFQQASDSVAQAGGGVLLIPSGDYLVGRQHRGQPGQPYWIGEPVIAVGGCAAPVVIRGEQGSRLRTAAGLKYGCFDPVTGQPGAQPGGSTDWMVSPYPAGMIDIQDNARVLITGLELDGSVQQLDIGGPSGPDGIQVAGNGIFAVDVHELEIRNVNIHHQASDGLNLSFKGLSLDDQVPTPIILDHVRSEFNARAGFSWHGGIGLRARDCSLSHTGRGGLATNPICGLDIETRDQDPISICRDARFDHCQFIDNVGVGIISDGGDPTVQAVMDVQDVTFNDCHVLTISGRAAVYPNRPAFRFNDCVINGWCIFSFSQPGLAVARPSPRYPTRYRRCTFEDVPYDGQAPVFPEAMALVETGGPGVTLERCRIIAHRLRALWANAPGLIARHCVIEHQWAQAPNGDYQSVLFGMELQDVQFRENLAGGPAGSSWWIDVGDTLVRDVRVQGPLVGWGQARLNGQIRDGRW
jgi:hypothetical protein